MLINIKLDGFPETILNRMVELGIASNKTEAIRLALMDYNEHHCLKKIERYVEDEMAIRKMGEIDKQISEGKRKVVGAKKAMGKYAKMLE